MHFYTFVLIQRYFHRLPFFFLSSFNIAFKLHFISPSLSKYHSILEHIFFDPVDSFRTNIDCYTIKEEILLFSRKIARGSCLRSNLAPGERLRTFENRGASNLVGEELRFSVDWRSIERGRLCKGLINRLRTRSLGQRSEDGDSVGAHCLRRRLKDRGSFRVSRGSRDRWPSEDRLSSSSLLPSPFLFVPTFATSEGESASYIRSSGSDQSY